MIRISLPKNSHAYRGRIYAAGEEHDVEKRDLDSLRAAGEIVVIVTRPKTNTEQRRADSIDRATPVVIQK